MARYTPFIPRPNAEMVNWSRNFSARLLEDPASWGVTPEAAGRYALLHAALEAAHARATDPATRTRPVVAARDAARRAAEADARRLARAVRAHSSVSEGRRIELGLGAAGESGGGTPIGAPASAPVVSIESAVGRTLRVRLRNAESMFRRARPAGVIGAVIFTYVGEAEAPADLGQWTFQGHTSRNVCTVTLPPTVPAGARVWVTACWLSPRLESGRAAHPAFANVPGGSAGGGADEVGVRVARRAA